MDSDTLELVAPCEHDYQRCGFTRTYTGLKWRHVAEVYCCTKCKAFAQKKTILLDGTFCTAADLQEVREAEQEAFERAKTEWLKCNTS